MDKNVDALAEVTQKLSTTDTQNQNADAYKRDIYGWLFAAMRATLVVNRIDNKDGAPSRALAKFRALLPVFIIAPLFLFRTRRLLTYAGELEMLTRDWSLTVSLFALSAHGVASTILLAVWNYKNVLNRFPLRLHAIVGSELTQSRLAKYKPNRVKAAIIFSAAAVLSIYFGIENSIHGNNYWRDANSTAMYRRSITQNNDLWPLDAVLFVCSTLISITAVLLYFLTIKAQVLETIAFNERLRTATNNGELRNDAALAKHSAQHAGLLKTFKFANSYFPMLTTLTLVFCGVSHVFAVLPMRAFSEELDVFTKALSVGLVALTLCIVFINIKTPAALNDANAETKNFLLLEHTIWETTDAKLHSTANGIIQRCTQCDFKTLIFDGIPVVELTAHFAFTSFGIIVEILAYRATH